MRRIATAIFCERRAHVVDFTAIMRMEFREKRVDERIVSVAMTAGGRVESLGKQVGDVAYSINCFERLWVLVSHLLLEKIHLWEREMFYIPSSKAFRQ